MQLLSSWSSSAPAFPTGLGLGLQHRPLPTPPAAGCTRLRLPQPPPPALPRVLRPRPLPAGSVCLSGSCLFGFLQSLLALLVSFSVLLSLCQMVAATSATVLTHLCSCPLLCSWEAAERSPYLPDLWNQPVRVQPSQCYLSLCDLDMLFDLGGLGLPVCRLGRLISPHDCEDGMLVPTTGDRACESWGLGVPWTRHLAELPKDGRCAELRSWAPDP